MWNIVLAGAVSRRRGIKVSILGSTLPVGHLLPANSFSSLWFTFIIYKLKTKIVQACLIAGRLKWLHPPCKVFRQYLSCGQSLTNVCHYFKSAELPALCLHSFLNNVSKVSPTPSALSSRALEWTCSTARLSFFPTPKSSGSLWVCGGSWKIPSRSN